MRRVLASSAVLLLALGCGADDAAAVASPTGDDDHDTITNGMEGSADERNSDGDAYPDYLDLDSDADGIADATEAGDADPATAPLDSDGDGKPDYLDTDSDDDGISDTDELDTEFHVVDTDGDGEPDQLDDDSDGDTIADLDETNADRNGNGEPNFRDLDSDGDGIPDAIEAGDAEVATKPVDTDGDGAPDFLDLDSDGDFVPDAAEDPNGNGVVDPGESSPTSADTDGDGTPDIVEIIAGSDPNDPSVNIPPGDFYFVLPYQGPGAEGPLDFSTGIRSADIFMSMDTTGSFQEEITAVQTALDQTIVPGIDAVIPKDPPKSDGAAFGVGRFEDLPHQPFGLEGDKPYELLQAVTQDIPSISAALAALGPAAGGLDTPEAGLEALYQWGTGIGMPDFGYLPFAPPGIGGVGFRKDALPIIVQITDARSHAPADYAALTSSAHGRDAVVAALTAIGARVIGIDSLENQGTPDDPRAYLEDLAIATKAVIPPDGATGKCLTGVGGSPRDPVVVNNVAVCPVVFDVLPDGTGLGSLIVDAVAQLATQGVLDISTKTIGQPKGLLGEKITPGFDTADFIKSVTPVPPPPAGATIQGDVFLHVTPGSTVTFLVSGFNDFQPATTKDQLFACDVDVVGDGITVLDVHKVYIIVPREIPDVPTPN